MEPRATRAVWSEVHRGTKGLFERAWCCCIKARLLTRETISPQPPVASTMSDPLHALNALSPLDGRYTSKVTVWYPVTAGAALHRRAHVLGNTACAVVCLDLTNIGEVARTTLLRVWSYSVPCSCGSGVAQVPGCHALYRRGTIQGAVTRWLMGVGCISGGHVGYHWEPCFAPALQLWDCTLSDLSGLPGSLALFSGDGLSGHTVG